MTNALPLWTIQGPTLGSWAWLRHVILITLLSVGLVLIGCSFASFVAAAEADIPVVIQMITNITNVIAPGVSAALQTAGGLALASLAILCGSPAIGATKCDSTSLIGQYQVATDGAVKTTLLQKIDAALAAVNAHVGDMLKLATGLPQNIGAAIVVGVGLALSTVVSLISLLPAARSAATGNMKAAKASASAAAKPLSAKQLKAQFNAAIGAQYPAAVVH